MRNSKKGVTLVELLICCAIIVLIGGAATSVLMSGHNVFHSGVNTANEQMSTEVVQRLFMKVLPSINNIAQGTAAQAKDLGEDKTFNSQILDDCGGIYFNDDGILTVRHKGTTTTIDHIDDFTYYLSPAGNRDTSRCMLHYKITFADGDTYESGLILTNVSFFKAKENMKVQFPTSDSPISLKTVEKENAQAILFPEYRDTDTSVDTE